MNTVKKARKRWRIVICAALSILLMAAIMMMQLLSGVDAETLSAQVRAGAAARQVAAQFEQAVEDGFRQLHAGEAAVNAGDEAVQNMLSSLDGNGAFLRTALISGGAQLHADGSKSAAEPAAASYILYKSGDVHGKIFMDAEGLIQLRLPVSEGRELAGWMDPDYIARLLGGAYPEDYAYALYNAATGAYLINTTDSQSARYFDTLLALNKGGRTSRLMVSQEAQAYIADEDYGYFYIAQDSTGIHPWNVALFMPEEILAVPVQNGSIPVWIFIVLSVLLMLCICVMAVQLIRNRRRIMAQRNECEQLRGAMLGCAADTAKAAFFVYSRRHERIIDQCDGMHMIGDVHTDSVSALTQAYGLNENDADRLYDRMRELKGDERAELRIACPLKDGECMLRFDLRCMEGNEDLVLVAIRDCTLESEREDAVKAEESFRRAMQSKASSVWEIDAVRNRWKLVSGRIPKGLLALGVNTNSWRDYTADLNGPMREFMDAGDYASYADVMSPDGLAQLLRSGRSHFVLECRVHAAEPDSYEWYRLELRIYRNAERGELMANLFVYNVDAVKNADLERKERARVMQQTLTALGGIYDGLYYVDLEKDICYTAKAFGSGISSQLSREFKGTFDAYIEQYVHPEDQDALRRLLSAYHLRRSMTEGAHLLRREYRRKHGEDYKDAVIIVQAARFENATVRDVVIAIRKHANINCVL